MSSKLLESCSKGKGPSWESREGLAGLRKVRVPSGKGGWGTIGTFSSRSSIFSMAVRVSRDSSISSRLCLEQCLATSWPIRHNMCTHSSGVGFCALLIMATISATVSTSWKPTGNTASTCLRASNCGPWGCITRGGCPCLVSSSGCACSALKWTVSPCKAPALLGAVCDGVLSCASLPAPLRPSLCAIAARGGMGWRSWRACSLVYSSLGLSHSTTVGSR
mmetsp:Transcript_14493/g.39240  ORF Transcript_14493/g.39240 Transcript_14493/m.39240 type:complete len:220 (-) Transcript_14493:290-949(-)